MILPKLNGTTDNDLIYGTEGDDIINGLQIRLVTMAEMVMI